MVSNGVCPRGDDLLGLARCIVSIGRRGYAARIRKNKKRWCAMQWDWNLRITDVAIVVATIAGPILAIQAQKWR